MGFSLFDRKKRKIALTQAGEIFLKHASNLKSDYQTMLSELSEFKTTPYFSILAIPVIAQYGITTYLASFKSAHPHLYYTLEEREASSIIPALNNNQHDMAFIRDNYLDKEIFSFLKITGDKLLVVVSKNHRFSNRQIIALNDLVDENFIMFDKGTIVYELTLDACTAAGFAPRIFYASLRVESILGLVSSNSGIALMMEKIFYFHSPKDVIAIPLQETIESNLILAWLKNKKLSRPAKIFIDFIDKALDS